MIRMRLRQGPPPMRLRRLPLKGAHPAAWQSQFRGCPGIRPRQCYRLRMARGAVDS